MIVMTDHGVISRVLAALEIKIDHPESISEISIKTNGDNYPQITITMPIPEIEQ